MRRWPAAIHVFMRNQMLCIGCPVGTFHTVSDACAAHGLDQETFWQELFTATRDDPGVDVPSFETTGAWELS
jgi:hybrid cluster-associated redox disulfide protein